MAELDRIIDQLQRAFDGDAWHGPSVIAALSGVTTQQAVAHPIPQAHSIWQIVLHLISWKNEVRRRLGGAEPASPIEGDWPEAGRRDPAAWSATIATLRDAHAALIAGARKLTDERLNEMVGSKRDAALGTGTFYVLLHGSAQHDIYHAGQISLLKKARVR
jgi:uncharacterized damage-inducible protein DinB